MNKYIRKSAVILFWMGVWTLLAVLVNNRILLVTPLEAARELVILLREPEFFLAVGRSLVRIGAGFFAGFGAAVLLAALGLRFPFIQELLSPVMSLMKTIPVASFVVLLLVWWGASFLSAAICFLVVLPNIYIGTLEGLKNTDEKLLEMAKVFRLRPVSSFFYIYRPALKPFLCSSMKIALGMCWKSGVAAEVIGIPDLSIGEQLYLSKIYLNTAGVFAWTAVIIVLSVLFEKLVLGLTEIFFAWQPGCGRPDKRESCGETKKSAVILRSLTRQFAQETVLDGINAEYEAGQTYYLREPSGSGKTTLLHILAGLQKPDSGSVEAPAAVSMQFQEDRLCEDYSAVKNVELVNGDREAARGALAELLEPEALDKPCRLLSGGMKRRVALVRALEADSDLVLLDEPFAGLDAETRVRAESYIRARRAGRILIIATHV